MAKMKSEQRGSAWLRDHASMVSIQTVPWTGARVFYLQLLEGPI